MAFKRRKVNKKTGKVYEYWQSSVRVPGRRTPKSIHLGKAKERVSPAMYLNDTAVAQNQKDLARGWAVDRLANPPEVCDPPAGKENTAPGDEGGKASE